MSGTNGTNYEENATASDGTTTLTVQLNTDMTAAQRFPAWLLLTVTSAICVIALQSRRGIFDVDGPGEAWVLSVGIISFFFSLASVIMYLCFRGVFVGAIPEAVMIGLLIAFWAAGLPTIMNPNNNIAVSPPDTNAVGDVVHNANLYFFSWISFCCTVFLSGSLLQDTMGVMLTQIAAKAARWYGSIASSLVVLGTSSRTFQAADCRDIDASVSNSLEYCRRSKLGVSLGVICFVIAAIMTFLVQQKKQLNACSDLSINTIYLLLWCFGVSYITFGESPGSTIGNLYFSSWISFLLAVGSFAVAFREFVVGRQQASDTSPQQDAPHPQFDDNI